MINKGRSPNLRHDKRTHRVDLDSFELMTLNHSVLINLFANKRSIGGYFDNGNVHHDAILWKISGKSDDPMNQVMSAAFLANPSLAQLQWRQAESQMMTQAEWFDQMWNEHSSKALKSGCILGDILTLEPLSNHEFTCTHHKRDLLAGMLFTMSAESNLLQTKSPFQILQCK